MRSSKSRSRSKSNRQRSLGNIVNRVFDSSGPEGKVRGTPQQIIDKYLMLARDAQLGNDRVAEQNFLQHAEHYTRMLGEAQRELAREQELRQGQGGYPQGGQNGNSGSGQYRAEPRDRDDDGYAPDADMQPPALPAIAGDEDAELVETPEARGDQRRRDDRPRDDRPRDDRPRDDRPRDDRSRDSRPRDNRPPRDQDRPAAATTAAISPATTPADAPADAPASEDTVGTAAPKADRGPKRPRQPRAPRPQVSDAGSEAVAAAEPATGTPDET